MGVIYLYTPYHKINGTVYYAFEYFLFLLKYNHNCKFYVVDLDIEGYNLFITIFKDKYNIPESLFNNIISIKRTEIFKLNLKKTLILDVRTFQNIQYFLTGDVHCFSNEVHHNFKGTSKYNVTYYGSYDYQNFDVFNYLKINFEIFKEIKNRVTNKVFISSRIDPECIDYSVFQTEKEIYKKTTNSIIHNLFDEIDEVIYYHKKLDTNNRIIVESFFYNKKIQIVSDINIIDSTILRYNDILAGNFSKYCLSIDDKMIQGMLNENN
jgi:hypothetical protein